MKTLTVELGERSYPIHIGPGLSNQADLLKPHIHGDAVMIVTNDVVGPLYLKALQARLSWVKQLGVVVLPDGEQHKNLETVNRIFDELLASRMGRTTTLVALGGGVVGDMAGFAAACYQRGIPFLQVPTTLLSQVDSSVGGKTGVNHALGKNMIGAFYQPQAVIIDTDTLKTLPEREVRAGLAEVIKYGLIADSAFLEWLETHMDALLRLDSKAIGSAVFRSCEIKSAIVAADETERGRRALLNLGHTFGHAMETWQQYGGLLHGEAVAVGMLMAADLSAREGWLGRSDVERVKALLIRTSLPIRAPEGMDVEDFLAGMAVDKKVVNGQIRLVLLTALGDAKVSADFSHEKLRETLSAFIH